MYKFGMSHDYEVIIQLLLHHYYHSHDAVESQVPSQRPNPKIISREAK